MFGEESSAKEYDLIVDILAEMVTNYVVQKDKNLNNEQEDKMNDRSKE